MDPSADELAGIVDTFGALTRDELTAAVIDLAARAGTDLDRDGLERSIEAAIDAYYLIAVDATAVAAGTPEVEPTVLVPGPAALPTLPEGGEDLPHLLDLDARRVDRAIAAEQVADQLRTDAAAAIDAEDRNRAEQLLDVCYEVEAWGPVDLADTRADLAELVE